MSSDKLTCPNKQKRFICEQVKKLTHSHIIQIHSFLNSKVSSTMFSDHHDGCSINLDKISNDIIQSLYTLVCDKLQENSLDSFAFETDLITNNESQY